MAKVCLSHSYERNLSVSNLFADLLHAGRAQFERVEPGDSFHTPNLRFLWLEAQDALTRAARLNRKLSTVHAFPPLPAEDCRPVGRLGWLRSLEGSPRFQSECVAQLVVQIL